MYSGNGFGGPYYKRGSSVESLSRRDRINPNCVPKQNTYILNPWIRWLIENILFQLVMEQFIIEKAKNKEKGPGMAR